MIFVCSFLFFCTIHSFGVRVTPASENELGNIPFSSIFRKILCRIDVNSSLNVCYNSPVIPFGLGKFFLLCTNSISLTVIELLDPSNSTDMKQADKTIQLQTSTTFQEKERLTPRLKL